MIEQRLQLAVKNPSHAYILIGPADEAKKLSRNFAKALQCENQSACGFCLSCRVFDSGNHPDIIYVHATKTKAIGVDDIRSQLVLPMSEKPFRYRYKIFIIDTPPTPEAQNALLKTVEEPAPFGVFLFLTESLDLLLPTVISRCVTLKLSSKLNAGQEAEAEYDKDLRQFAKSAATTDSMDIPEVYDMYAEFDKRKELVLPLLDMIYLNLHNRLLVSGAGSSPKTLAKIDAVAAAKKAITHNGNFQMTIETMLLKMR